MNEDQLGLARTMFRLKIYSSNGQAFENLFVHIMQHFNPNFIPIKPQGRYGDRSNDGYDKTTGKYYQVYAPEDVKKSVNNAISKVDHDFKGIKFYWENISPVREFYFVLNDKYQGPFPEIEKILSQIKNTYNLNECKVFLAQHLEQVLFSLDHDIIVSIVGHMPKLTPQEYFFLNGFVYFMGAWLEFERWLGEVAIQELHLDERYTRQVQPSIRALCEHQRLSIPERDKLLDFARCRNNIVHGRASYEVLTKEYTDELVSLTTDLKKRFS